MGIVVLCTIMLTISMTCAIIGIGLSIYAVIEVKALMKSTHNIQYVPLDEKWASSDKEMEEKLSPLAPEQPEVDGDEVDEPELDLRNMI